MFAKLTKTFILCAIIFYKPFGVSAQDKQLTLETIFEDYEFIAKKVTGINWMQNGRYYTSLINQKGISYIIQYDITTGNVVDTLLNGKNLQSYGFSQFDDYSFSNNGVKVLLATEETPIYRRSSEAHYYIYDFSSKKVKKLAKGAKQQHATFSPDGSKIAYAQSNNIFYLDLLANTTIQVTKDGKINEIIHGTTDWVYEEEFSFTKAFFWSPDSKRIAYYTFDESEVPVYNLQLWPQDVYPYDYYYKYPKAGEKNSIVKITSYTLSDKQHKNIDLGKELDIYIPRVIWTKNANILSVVRMNRLQNKLEILHADVISGKTKVALTEMSNTYVDLDYNDDLTYLADGKSFIYTSEQDGFKHIYHYKLDGKLIRQITKGNWEVDELVGIDEKKKLIYYLSTEDSPLERQFYAIQLNGKKKRKLSVKAGTHQINMSPDFSYYIDVFSSDDTPPVTSLYKAPSGSLVKILEKNEALVKKLSKYTKGSREYFTFPTTDKTMLNGYIIKPSHFDPSKKYPVLMFVYGGPGSQKVTRKWLSLQELWFCYLAEQGYLVACVDNRGTGGRGKTFKHITYGQLGKVEVEDQIEGAKYLGNLSYIDKDRIGIWGWSYGGYMSSLALFLGSDYFKAAIAVAPVTNWRFYDTIYTERYLKKPQDNPEGYDKYSPLSHADKLKGNYLLIHGTGDDNVHVHNALALQQVLIEYNKQFEVFYYPNLAHSLYGPGSYIHLYTMMTNFLKRSL